MSFRAEYIAGNGKTCYIKAVSVFAPASDEKSKEDAFMKKRIFALFMVCIMLIGIVPAASAEDAHEITHEDCAIGCEEQYAPTNTGTTPCPVCGLSLNIETTNSIQTYGTSNACYRPMTTSRLRCNQHGYVGTGSTSYGEIIRNHNYPAGLNTCSVCKYYNG